MAKLKGRLFLLPSPIVENGLESISPEVIRILHSLDFFIVERARTARRFISATKPPKAIDLLTIEEIPEKTLSSNEIELLLQPALDGHDMGLMSEAGLPAIADPGQLYVSAAQKHGIKIVPLSGPSSIMMALMGSGLEGQRFAFHGYLSAKKDELPGQLKELEKKADRDDATQIWIETPYRNLQILQAVEKHLDQNRNFCIAAGLGNETGMVITKKIMEWKKSGWPEIHKVPAVFLIR
ncbi:MAG TPA: SAM-dependent methyltransferase [Saprospiraceae bacterium]|nr:SAM-dependent methyltransferase [Saprospiraceae bacterium]